MKFPKMWYVRPAKTQISLRVRAAQSDQSLCWSLEYYMTVKLLTEHNLEFLSLTGGCTGSSVCIHVKVPYCWKSHVTAHIFISRLTMCGESPLPVFTRNRWLSKEIFSNKHPVAKRGAQIYMCRTYLTVLAFLISWA